MRVSPETIYQAIYVQARGGLRREIADALGTGRTRRKPHRSPQQRTRRFVDEMVMICERLAEIGDLAVPGHWEGDLIIGRDGASAIGTLVERSTRYVMLVHLPRGRLAEAVRDALIDTAKTLPSHLVRSLTWDQGSEMAAHGAFSAATEISVYFCDPASPWQRGSNENTNGLLRQYFPKGTDLARHSAEHLAAADGGFVDDGLGGGECGDQGWEGQVVDGAGVAASGGVDQGDGVVGVEGVGSSGDLHVVGDVVAGLLGRHCRHRVAQRDALFEGCEGTHAHLAAQGGLADQQAGKRGCAVHFVVGQHSDCFELAVVEQVGLVDQHDRGAAAFGLFGASPRAAASAVRSRRGRIGARTPRGEVCLICERYRTHPGRIRGARRWGWPALTCGGRRAPGGGRWMSRGRVAALKASGTKRQVGSRIDAVLPSAGDISVQFCRAVTRGLSRDAGLSGGLVQVFGRATRS